MAASGTLYTYPDNFRAFKALISSQYSGSSVQIDSNFVFGETNKTDEFLNKFPFGKVPAFETSDGKCIFESNAIAWSIANDQLRGKTPIDQAHVIQWMCFADNEILPASCTWVFPLLGIMQYNKNSAERAKEDIKKVLQTLNSYLLTRTYFVGERITLADITICCTLLHLYQHVFDPTFRKPYINVNRWFNTIINQPQVKAVIGEFKLCEKMLQFDNKKFAEMQVKIKQSSGEKKEKPKKEKQAEAQEAAEEAAPAVQAPKQKDPLDALPAGTFNMDDWKRFYSNNDVELSVPYFWEKFDKDNYSIWFCDYKYTDDLTRIFMTCNLVTGMFQRLDKMRKNAFASVCIFGEDNKNAISGVWVWRGHELAFNLCEDWQVDFESYSWRKLDADADETKEMVEKYFKMIGKDGQGREFNQGKIFK